MRNTWCEVQEWEGGGVLDVLADQGARVLAALINQTLDANEGAHKSYGHEDKSNKEALIPNECQIVLLEKDFQMSCIHHLIL